MVIRLVKLILCIFNLLARPRTQRFGMQLLANSLRSLGGDGGDDGWWTWVALWVSSLLCSEETGSQAPLPASRQIPQPNEGFAWQTSVSQKLKRCCSVAWWHLQTLVGLPHGEYSYQVPLSRIARMVRNDDWAPSHALSRCSFCCGRAYVFDRQPRCFVIFLLLWSARQEWFLFYRQMTRLRCQTEPSRDKSRRNHIKWQVVQSFADFRKVPFAVNQETDEAMWKAWRNLGELDFRWPNDQCLGWDGEMGIDGEMEWQIAFSTFKLWNRSI